MDGFDATPVELQVCGTKLADISREVVTTMSALKADVEAILNGGWHGAAADGFAHGWEQWLAGAQDVLNGLSDMGRLLGATGQEYASGDQASADLVTHSGEDL